MKVNTINKTYLMDLLQPDPVCLTMTRFLPGYESLFYHVLLLNSSLAYSHSYNYITVHEAMCSTGLLGNLTIAVESHCLFGLYINRHIDILVMLSCIIMCNITYTY